MGIGSYMTYLVPPTILFIPLTREVGTREFIETCLSLVLVIPTSTSPLRSSTTCSSTSSSRASPARRSSSGSSEPSRHHWGGVLMKLRTLVGIGIAGFIVVGSGGAWYAGGASPAAAQSDQPAVEKGV